MLESLVQEVLGTKSRVRLAISTSTCQAREAGSIAGQGREQPHVRYRLFRATCLNKSTSY